MKMKNRSLSIVLATAASIISCGTGIERDHSVEARDFVEGIVSSSLRDVSAQIRDGVLGNRPQTVRLPGKLVEYPFIPYREFIVRSTLPPDDSLRANSRDDPAM